MNNKAPSLLSSLCSPEDLKSLSVSQLEELSEEMRTFIIETLSETGGHLAPNLGVVELTLALHYVFTSPKDSIIWDVGHQAYTHKIICGRQEQFCTLRQGGGLSGFPKMKESPHDAFETGHASTSVAAALGFAAARDVLGEDGEVIAVIGDGALTGGLAYEGLNNAGDQGRRMTVILNDNSMSIAPNVGAMSRYLSRVRSDPTYNRLKDDVDLLLKSIPRVGPSMVGSLRRVKGSLKYLLLPGMLFEELGFTYIGPVDGHNVRALIQVLKRSKSVAGPVLIHVNTVKGKGYAPAEERPEKFHGIGAFDVITGNGAASKSKSYTDVFSETLVDLAGKDHRVAGITAAMPEGTGLDRLAEQYPERYFDFGIAEPGAVTFAAGLAARGLRPVVAIYSTFMQRAYDQVVHDVAHQELPVVFAIDRAGVVGADGDTHQGAFDIALFRHVPNVVLMAPRDEPMLQRMLATGLAHETGPSILRFPRGSGPGSELLQDPTPIEIGTAEQLASGTDGGIIAFGHPVQEALRARELLAARGINLSVVDARFVKPLDETLLLQLARELPLLVTVEEGVLQGGFGSAVVELFADHLTPEEMPRIRRLGLPDRFIPHGDQKEQRVELGLDAAAIVRAVESLMQQEQPLQVMD